MAMAGVRFMFCVSLAWCVSAARDGPSNLEFYVHNPGLFTSFPAPAATALTSTNLLAMKGEPRRDEGSFQSRIITFDNAITAGGSNAAGEMGRAHGIRVVDRVGDGPLAFTWLFTASFVFGDAGAGTLSFQGTTRNFPSSDVSQITVTGGTGAFRFARGYATFTNFYRDDEISTLEGQHFQVFLRY